MDLYSTVSEINGGICVKCNFITHYPRKCATAFGFKIYNDGLLHGEKKLDDIYKYIRFDTIPESVANR